VENKWAGLGYETPGLKITPTPVLNNHGVK